MQKSLMRKFAAAAVAGLLATGALTACETTGGKDANSCKSSQGCKGAKHSCKGEKQSCKADKQSCKADKQSCKADKQSCSAAKNSCNTSGEQK